MINDLNLKLKARNIKLVAFDVDGVMTDGSLIYLPDGQQVKSFNAKDGQGIVMLNKSGFLTAIITAKESEVVVKRAETLGITKLFAGQKNKLKALEALCLEFKLEKSQIAYMGDDYPDLGVIRQVGLSSCPCDAIADIKKNVSFISEYAGGHGAVRQFCDFILYSNNISFDFL